ncbi:MAG: outer membrane protein transport protein [Myxococcota bacterium]|nr:outer membrane protein transport protein [Myxococcota bacterium]
MSVLYADTFLREAKTQVFFAMIVFSLLTGNVASASPFDLYGAGSRGSAMGNTGVASGQDCAASFYNPGALTGSPPQVTVGLHSALKQLSIRLSERPAGYEIPDLGFDSPAVPSKYRIQPRRDTALDQLGLNLYGGATTDLGHEDLRLGLLFSLPLYRSENTQGSFFSDEREQFFSNQLHFDLLGSRVDRFVTLIAGAWRVTPWLSLGLGAQLSVIAESKNAIYMDDPTRQDQIDLNVGLETQTRWSPNAGLFFTPSDTFQLGVSFRDEQYTEIIGVNEVQVRGLQDSESYPFKQKINLTLEYQPRQFLWGATWKFGAHQLNTDLVYLLWSDYPTHHQRRAGLEDTLSLRVGLEHQLDEALIIRWGGAYEPTPVGEQSGRLNLVDNDRLVGSLGAGHRFRFAEKVLQLSWHLQLHWLAPRSQVKSRDQLQKSCATTGDALCDEVPDDPELPETLGLQTGNPGFPGFSSGGILAHFGVELSWSF